MALAPPTASPMPPDGSAMMDDGGSMAGTDSVVCTICKRADGSYVVYAGDEPETAPSGADTAGDMGEDDVDAMGPAGDEPVTAGSLGSGSGKTADSEGATLKLVMDILRQDSAGGPGNADAQFAAGYSSDKTPTPMGMGGGGGLKYGATR